MGCSCSYREYSQCMGVWGMGCSCSYREYGALGHSLSLEELEHVRAWLAPRLLA